MAGALLQQQCQRGGQCSAAPAHAKALQRGVQREHASQVGAQRLQGVQRLKKEVLGRQPPAGEEQAHKQRRKEGKGGEEKGGAK